MLKRDCPIEKTLNLITGKWKSVIIFQLFEHQKCRFSELQRLIPECSKRMLALQLKELEKANIIQKNIILTSPAKTEYSLTPYGQTLEPVIKSIDTWGKQQKN
ncbi:helix-turn-helix transcriptional regulator [Limosilactobacillus sp. STM2_1]|uniref:Helix-turn-helix transcriptional regulator n=1 Tax=Limosilactobacillus rudii TaxID=2759755 RepID=A0A7W3UKT3_9LACO|nr:helix-turn-helix domain-containing protein [Limosilactobacillus rudii]MBB1079252.1 helix-turn-helix transcriptional regulator [Limosilactobacillus rudii]MBB1097341.1 helix-turn-helix transcriptional regulator [Limosilactobacillus rudii]MCD7134450.1 helix-turn-helix transcriptional regulator [Limosilactobacillus rudii]